MKTSYLRLYVYYSNCESVSLHRNELVGVNNGKNKQMMRFVILGVVAFMLAACSGGYRTYYENQIDSGVSRGWRVSTVTVSVPDELTVSEALTYIPRADIVWREDPPGDRKAQISAVLRNAIQRGASGLRGPRPVRLVVTVNRFHALTFEAEATNYNGGVHNLDFNVAVLDARTGAELVAPMRIEADVPAFSGAEAVQRRLNGETQRSVITNHVSATIAAWLGIGPDNRGEFSRAGD